MHAQRLRTADANHLFPAEKMRLTPVLSLLDGDTHGLLSEAVEEFEERVSFGPAAKPSETPDPAEWLATQLERLARLLADRKNDDRPVIVAAPLTALAHSNTALAADAAIRRTEVCHQEICLEFGDAAFAGDPADVIQRVANLKRRGFRVGVDMRKSCTSPLGDGLRLLLDTLRIDASQLDTDQNLRETVEAARATGVFVIAENAKWRDGDYLESLGVLGATRPLTDA